MIALSNWTNHWSIQIENFVIRIHAGHMEHVKSLVIRTHASVRMGGGKPQFSYHFFIFWRKAWKFTSFIIFNKNIEKPKLRLSCPIFLHTHHASYLEHENIVKRIRGTHMTLILPLSLILILIMYLKTKMSMLWPNTFTMLVLTI